MSSATLSRRTGAVAFVLAAVAATVAVVALINSGGSSAPHIVGPGAAPAPAAPAAQSATTGTVFDSASSPQQVADQASGVNGTELAPLRPAQFDAPVARYRRYARRRVATLAGDVRILTAALGANDRAAARAAWQRTDSSMNRIGAAYGALGTLGDEIDGFHGALPDIEAGLWGRAKPKTLTADAHRLAHDVARLRPVLAHAPIDPLTYATRAHEILEDVQRDRLTLHTPSDSGVRATADGVAATRVVLATLAPLLTGRGDAIIQSDYWLRRLSAELRAIRRAHGGRYPPVSQLSRREHETLDGVLGATLEALSGIPGELETQVVPTIPRITP
jgi:hypothetical protein